MSIHTIGIPQLNRPKQHKSHSLDYVNGYAVVRSQAPIGGGEKITALGELKDEDLAELDQTTNVMYKTTTGRVNDTAVAEAPPQYVPAFVAFDKMVLRFKAYFKETVEESRDENYRVRQVEIMYYLEDDSISINEKKRANTGLPQGTFIKRHCIANPDRPGDTIHFSDLVIGSDVTIYGRRFHIYDVDTFTREYLDVQGINAGQPEELPEDPYEVRRREKNKVVERPNNKPAVDPYAQFLAHDGETLHFYCRWDDSDQLYGEPRKFLLQYFLADDTVEVNEIYKPNSGYSNFPKFFRRNKLAKSTRLPQPGEKLEHVTMEDLAVGKEVNVSGRDFFIYDCSERTRNYYRDHFGIDMQPIDAEESRPPTPKVNVPPPTGFGSEEDSLGSVMALVPRPPRKNLKKMMENEGKTLRFSARLDTAKPDDIDRRFIVTFYLSDDTVQVFEPPQRNSGIVGGKFLERRRVNNPQTHAPFTPQDFYVGAIVTLLSSRFVLLDADEFCLNYMEDNAKEFPKSNVRLIEQKFRETIAANDFDMRAVFDGMDQNGDGWVGIKEFRHAIRKFGFNLSEQELLTVMRAYDHDRDGKISYAEFVKTVTSDEEPEPEEQSYQPGQDGPTPQDYAIVEKFMDMLRDKLYNRKSHIRHSFRDLDTDHDSRLSQKELRQGLVTLDLQPPDHLLDLVLAKFFYDPEENTWKDPISYEEFIAGLWEGKLTQS
eukprot:TRINITY_DN9832_c0_g2_i1.p1 TRINITY_DN9832_c0_g2~~TRINITY_DN9832_c0_g2_i1.p1  ORF type:complete len:713 (-),score=250.44 TRINITY_DN9832_c0_g2_i1:235-2373(-)